MSFFRDDFDPRELYPVMNPSREGGNWKYVISPPIPTPTLRSTCCTLHNSPRCCWHWRTPRFRRRGGRLLGTGCGSAAPMVGHGSRVGWQFEPSCSRRCLNLWESSQLWEGQLHIFVIMMRLISRLKIWDGTK